MFLFQLSRASNGDVGKQLRTSVTTTTCTAASRKGGRGARESAKAKEKVIIANAVEREKVSFFCLFPSIHICDLGDYLFNALITF